MKWLEQIDLQWPMNIVKMNVFVKNNLNSNFDYFFILIEACFCGNKKKLATGAEKS